MHCKLHLSYTLNGNPDTVESEVGSTSVNTVCTRLIENYPNTTWAKYAEFLTGQRDSYTMADAE